MIVILSSSGIGDSAAAAESQVRRGLRRALIGRLRDSPTHASARAFRVLPIPRRPVSTRAATLLHRRMSRPLSMARGVPRRFNSDRVRLRPFSMT